MTYGYGDTEETAGSALRSALARARKDLAKSNRTIVALQKEMSKWQDRVKWLEVHLEASEALLAELAEHTGAELLGNPDVCILGVNTLEEATQDDASFLAIDDKLAGPRSIVLREAPF